MSNSMSVLNRELDLAADFVKYTNQNIFLTGKAGTGKTTFLKSLSEITPKRFVVVAPTGVAAINAGGMTIHSFFQMSFAPFIPGNQAQSRESQYRFSKEKVKIIRSLDLLVIDEISMVRADLLDGIDSVLRRYRRSPQPFGGVQLLMIGDLHQLSPVVKDDEWQILRQYYSSYFFFSSLALKKTTLIPIELKHIYRQSEETFVHLLNRVRDNKLDLPTLQQLNSRYIEGFAPKDDEGYITLSSHNYKVDSINDTKLAELSAKQHKFRATIDGTFPEYSYPTAQELELKVGAQVMFVKNDISPEKRYFNGKIGKLEEVRHGELIVRCPGDDEEIVVEKATWENIKYTIDPDTKEITEEIVGKFIQYPLKLAWAITIHKSQGLTFERAIIDANSSFAHGQVYVALSRCKTFEGMVLSSPISSHSVKTDETVSGFVDYASNNPPSENQLLKAKIEFQQKLIADCFDFRALNYRLSRLMTVHYENKQLIHFKGVEGFEEIEKKALAEIFAVGTKFQRQLEKIFNLDEIPPEESNIVQERVKKAGQYFDEKINSGLYELASHLGFESDNKELKKKAKEALDTLRLELSVRMAGIKCCVDGFDSIDYLRSVAIAEVSFEPAKKEKKAKEKPIEYSDADVQHPELVERLKNWRHEKATEAGLPHYRILHQKTMIQLAVVLPKQNSDLLKVKGIGPSLAEKFGKELLEIIVAYRDEKGIENHELPLPKPVENKVVEVDESASEPEKPKEKKPKVPTALVTLELFKQGKTVEEIAEERGFAVTTIEGHLGGAVKMGELSVFEMMKEDRVKVISEAFSKTDSKLLRDVKDILGDEYSWGEIKLVEGHLRFVEGEEKSGDE